jgi:hypothetical protein
MAAAFGTLAMVYTASKAPGASCPCVIFETSTDYGASFTRHIVPLKGAAQDPDPYVASDPGHRGDFALTVLDSTGTKNQVYVTEDSGRTWHGPTDVSESSSGKQFKPWISFGGAGQIALVWRTWHGAPGKAPYDVWAAVGRANGRRGPTFSTAFRVSSVAAAYPSGYQVGDDFSWVVAAGKYVNVGWGDSRNLGGLTDGGVQVWYARIPTNSFHG